MGVLVRLKKQDKICRVLQCVLTSDKHGRLPKYNTALSGIRLQSLVKRHIHGSARSAIMHIGENTNTVSLYAHKRELGLN